MSEEEGDSENQLCTALAAPSPPVAYDVTPASITPWEWSIETEKDIWQTLPFLGTLVHYFITHSMLLFM